MSLKPASASRRPDGFTLLELVLTLAVILVIAAITVPNIFDILSYRQLVRGGNGVRVAMVQARLEAMRTGRTQMMSFQTEGQQFKVEPYMTAEDVTEAADMLGQGTAVAMGGSAFVAPTINQNQTANPGNQDAGPVDPMNSRMDQETLPGEALFGVVQVQATARSLTMQQQSATLNSNAASPTTGEGGWSQPILFYPDGTTSNAVVSITLNGTSQVQVKIRGLTGETDVTEVLPL